MLTGIAPAPNRFFPPQKLLIADYALAEPEFFFGLLAVDVLDTERRRYRHHAQSRHRDARLAHTRTSRSEVTDGRAEEGPQTDVVITTRTKSTVANKKDFFEPAPHHLTMVTWCCEVTNLGVSADVASSAKRLRSTGAF